MSAAPARSAAWRVKPSPLVLVLVLVLALMTAGSCMISSPALGSEPALAETLYQEGRALMAQGRTGEACAKFEESLRVDQATGTLLNLAVCHEELGRFATAWAEFRAAASIALHDKREDRARLAHDHLDRIEPRLSWLTIAVPETALVAGLRITLDGTSLGQPAWNIATPIDPGNHVVTADAPGHATFTQAVIVGTSASRPTVLVALAPAPAAQAPVSTSATNASREPPRVTPDAEVSAPATGPAAYVLTGLGIAGLAVGAVFGVRALSRWSDRNRECPMDACTDAGLAYSRQAETAALTADVAVGAGVVGLAVGGYLFYRAHSRAAAAARAPVSLTSKDPHHLTLAASSLAPFGLAIGLDW